MVGQQALREALAGYDGRDVGLLEELRREFSPTATTLRAAVALSCGDDVQVARGASWLLLEWLEAGARATPKVVEVLFSGLPGVRDKWVRLHVVRALACLPLVGGQIEGARSFLEEGLQHELPFVRAWSIDSLWRLAATHRSCVAAAQRAVAMGQDDEAASVRARVRNIVKGR